VRNTKELGFCLDTEEGHITVTLKPGEWSQRPRPLADGKPLLLSWVCLATVSVPVQSQDDGGQRSNHSNKVETCECLLWPRQGVTYVVSGIL
jgi:hypothetical protein